MKIKKLYIGLLALGISLSSCTKYDNPAPFFEEYEKESQEGIKKKVLIINVDGLVGAELKKYIPANMTKMLANSKYSFSAQSDNVTSDPASLVSLITGVPSGVHKVFTDSYMPVFDNSDPHGDSHFVPSFIYRLESVDKSKNTSVFMRNLAFTGGYLTDADLFVTENTDDAVKTRALQQITNSNPDLVVVQLSDVQEAGVAGGFLISNDNYKQALDKVDGIIGELVSAIESRENEDWLVVVCSAHGGTEDGKFGGSSEQEKGTFSMYYNEKFQSHELIGEGMTSFYANGYFPGTYNYADNSGKPRVFTELGVRAQSPAGATSNLFNAATAGEISYEFKMKLREDMYWAGTTYSGGYRSYYNFVLGKDDSDGVSAGWHIQGIDRDYNLRIQNGSRTEALRFTRGVDGEWNHFVITFKADGASRTKATVYVNGIPVSTTSFGMPIGEFSNTQPLNIGFGHQGTTIYAFFQADIADVRVWNKELTLQEVQHVACTKWISDSFSAYNNLLAYYENFDGDTWKNVVLGKGAPDMTLSNHGEVTTITNIKTICETAPTYVYLQNIDLARQVFYWLEVDVNNEWGIQGQLFLNNFENEFKQ